MNDGKAIGLIIALGILLTLSAFFSATETAYTSFSQARMKGLALNSRGARLALKLSGNYNRILSTLLIGNNIVNIAAASLATLVFTHYFGDLGVTLSTIVMTVLVLIFGEISPKSMAKERPEEFAVFSARPLFLCAILFTPLNFLFDCWKKLLTRIFRLHRKRPSMTEEEFRIIVTDIRNEGILNETEHDIIQNTIRYDETLVSSVMTPAEQVTAVERETPLSEIKRMFLTTNYSRVPVYHGDLDRIAGILYRADFYELMLDDGTDIGKIIKPVLSVSPAEKISSLCKHLQRAQQQVAVVREEDRTVGLVSMEDILEELVGEIDDKYDNEQPQTKGRPAPAEQEQPVP